MVITYLDKQFVNTTSILTTSSLSGQNTCIIDES